MQSMTIKEIAQACGGSINGAPSFCDTLIHGIRIDSRKVESGDLFIAVKGESLDGHDYIDSAVSNGAACVVSEKLLGDLPHILVKSTFAALKDIAEYYRSLFDIKVIGITGSVGKTTAKEMVASVLSQKYNVLKTQGNFNNEFGLPQTIFNIEPEHDIAVIEMGMNSLGEISRLSKIARPDAALIINIGDSHIGNLGSRENIFKAKCEIFEYMDDDAPVFLNGDDDMLVSLTEQKTIYFGRQSSNDVSLDQIRKADSKGTHIVANCGGEQVALFIPVQGEYMIYPTLAAVAIGKEFSLSNEQIANGVESFVPVSQRMNTIKTDKITIIDDAYNASKQSILAGAGTLTYSSGRRVAIIGDVKELGEFSESIHFEIGEQLGEMDIDCVICVGDDAQYIMRGASSVSHGSVYYYPSKTALFRDIDVLINEGDTVFVKASRGMHFEEIVGRLKTL
jgi:UDP-N-acetylmuramoyl-tripeptide--D-alanyl-D-alanine ligase